jgi:integrase
VRDVLHLRAATGLHHTEIQQLVGAKVVTGPLPDTGTWVRELPESHAIAGVLQVVHKKKSQTERRHRVSVDRETLEAAKRLGARVPDRITMWEKLAPLTPSNLRHTFVTLAGEVGELVTYVAAGVDRARIAQAVGHRAGSSMTADRYDKLQVPPMIRLPLPWVTPPEPASGSAAREAPGSSGRSARTPTRTGGSRGASRGATKRSPS